jgi:exonuclease SbcD
MTKIRMLHFADLHIGMENYGKIDPQSGVSSRMQDFLARLDEVVDYAIAAEVDLVVFAGDAFKTRDPDSTQQREFAKRIKKLATLAPVVLLAGNHDMPGMVQRANSMEIYNTLEVENVILAGKPLARVVETRRGPVFLACMPYPMRNRLLTQNENRGKSITELEATLQREVQTCLARFAEQAQQYDMPRVLTGHFTVGGAKFGSERLVMLGQDVPVGRGDLADEAWDYVALGHIHAHQDVNQGLKPPIVYSGSLERIDFGEERDPKGFCWVELARGQSEWRFVPVNARIFETIYCDLRADTDPTRAVLQRLANADFAGMIVRLRLKLKAEQVPLLQERDLEAALKSAYHFSIQKDIEHSARARLGSLSVETLNPTQLVERYFQDKGKDSDRIAKLVQLAQQIFNDA